MVKKALCFVVFAALYPDTGEAFISHRRLPAVKQARSNHKLFALAEAGRGDFIPVAVFADSITALGPRYVDAMDPGHGAKSLDAGPVRVFGGRRRGVRASKTAVLESVFDFASLMRNEAGSKGRVIQLVRTAEKEH